jgi:hypothetical protein
MELFKNIRLKIGKAALKKKAAHFRRKVFYSNFQLVKNIGIVWDASKTAEFPSLSRFHQKMHERNIEVSVLGYFPGNELPDQYTAIMYLTCIRKNELSYNYHPVSKDAVTFINKRFDVLLDINFAKLFPLQCITSLSKAGFKVGLAESGTSDSVFDLMIEVSKPLDVETYLNQVMHYLAMINSGGDKKFN